MANDDYIASLKNVSLSYKDSHALDDVTLDIPKGKMIALIGPDGVGKSSLLALISGAKKNQKGEVVVLGDSMTSQSHRRQICPKISYMPQGLGKNLYPILTVFENIDFFARLFGLSKEKRKLRIDQLLASTGLSPFSNRPVGQLSGGMKQKLGLCCSLIHDPNLLILDEPTTGVDPLSRRQFWSLIKKLRARRPDVSVIVATAYMQEASTFDWLVMMNRGQILNTGTPKEILEKTQCATLEEGFIKLLPDEQKRGYEPIISDHRQIDSASEIVIEAHDLSKSFDGFVAVDRVSFRITRGEIYGFIGSNGCGKTTTMKMLTGLLPVTSGEAFLFGHPISENTLETSMKVGFMTQSFSLYRELTVRQNLVLHARLFNLDEQIIAGRIDDLASQFDLLGELGKLPLDLPLGVRQRLSLATALIHQPEILILDEPTSGVDPIARDAFWKRLIFLAREKKVTIFISTHFMNEAERCDRIALMHAGRVLETGTPEEIIHNHQNSTLEDAFIEVLESAGAGKEESALDEVSSDQKNSQEENAKFFSLERLFSYSYRESLELLREPVRFILALFGSVFLLIVMCFGISFDVENLPFAVWDQDQSSMSRDYIAAISGSKYFALKEASKGNGPMNQAVLDQMMKSNQIGLAIQIPPDFEKDLVRGAPVSIGAWVDGSMPTRGETIMGYVQGMHAHWLQSIAAKSQKPEAFLPPVNIEVRYRYNPEVKSIVAIVPAVIPILLLFIPAMLTALAVVREKELGSIINLYVTPVSRFEFMVGKQLPYLILSILNFILLLLISIFFFGIPMKGSFFVLLAAAVLYLGFSTAFGLFMSAFTKSQIAAITATAILSILPAVEFSGLITPVSSLKGIGRFIGEIYPTTHFLIISQGVFSKAISFNNLYRSFIALFIAFIITTSLGVLLLNKQER